MTAPAAPDGGFSVDLEVFSGPFDLLLQLIAKHQLDVTEVALAQVTDEFIAYAFSGEEDWDLSQASQFLVIAATLLDLKALRLLPRSGDADEEDLELFEARDLLFARLLQYRAFKEVAAEFEERLADAGRSTARSVEMEPQFAQLLPELIWSIGPNELAVLAAAAFARDTSEPTVTVDHLHHPVVPVPQQAAIIVEALKRQGRQTFKELVADAANPAVVVSRFLALLELYRDEIVDFDQPAPGDELAIVYLGSADTVPVLTDEYDDERPSDEN
ncbi:hypothetical protein BSZ39_09070 [Bowdeniella nasicola]|uniref:Segregation and condensation protein A n=1 Tax=Bowdeniella nasicola TaxID=208480 RepID=A0A1Q5Q152_9ACTO|nr:ScpA family protein [Bowdeniella nasicola]OKL53527.1 hypothetical protein BSZ39_09070 [Bowdeniella nasicola]